MTQSLSSLYIHLIFHIKNKMCPLEGFLRDDIYKYMYGILKNNDSKTIIINGTHNHVHLLFKISKNISLSQIVLELKQGSSKYIKTLIGGYEKFSWQNGYAGFSVSHSVIEQVEKYIKNQEEHHKKISFQDEYKLFLDKNAVLYDEKFLW